MEVRDVYKLLYQGIMGLEHLVTSPEDFAARLRAEYESVSPDAAEPLWEAVRPDEALGRLNLRPFKARRGDVESLVAACLETAERIGGRTEILQAAWITFIESCRAGQWQAFPLAAVLAFTDWLEDQGYPAVHHSARYVELYRPAYRLVGGALLEEL